MKLFPHSAACHLNHVLALRTHFPEHLHPLNIGAVTVRMRQHFMHHQDI
jgi:hypothetical protein